MESGAIPDADIYSLKFWGSNQFAYTGRLNSPYPHCYKTNFDANFYVHFEELQWIVAVVVQGFNNDGLWSSVGKFKIATKLDFTELDITRYDNQFSVGIYIACIYRVIASESALYRVSVGQMSVVQTSGYGNCYMDIWSWLPQI